MRQIIDKEKEVSIALPAAGATAVTPSIDLGYGPSIPEAVELQVEVEAVPNLVDTKTIITTLQDSADNLTFAAVADFATYTQTGAGGAGAATVKKTLRLPSSIRRYIRASSAVLAAGGDNTANKVWLRLTF